MNFVASDRPRSGFPPLAALLAASALVVPATVAAQDPSVDQYSATTPDAGGSTTPGQGPGAGAPVPAAGAGENKAQRDLASIARSAERERETGGGANAGAATELLRGSRSETGPFIWVALGATLLWAVGSALVRVRDRSVHA